MTKEQFIIKAKELGYSNEDISEILKTHVEAEQKGIVIPLEWDLIELPIEN